MNSKLEPGYKQTEVGVIPHDWDVTSVGSEFSIQLGKMLDAAKNIGLPKPYIGNRAVQWGRIDVDDISTVAMTCSDLERFRLRRGDLLVCEGGEIGRAAIWNEPIPECYYQKALHRLRPTRGYDVFLMMSMLRLWTSTGYLADYVTQTSIAHLPKDKFERVFLPVPPPREQRAIAGALSDVDGLIGALEKLIAKNRAIKQAAMQQLLTGKTRLPEFERKPGCRQTEAGIVPVDWGLRPLGSEVVQLEAGLSVNSVDDEPDTDSFSCAILKTSAVEDGKFLPHECKKIAPKDLHRVTLSARADSILISRMNTIDLVGECGYVPADFPRLFVPDRLWMTRFRPGSRISARWLSYLLSSNAYRRAIRVMATGTSGSMKNISKGALRSLPVAFPCEDEQQAIAAVLSDMDAEIAALERRRDKTKAIKQGMMQQLLTGRIRLVKPAAPAVKPEPLRKPAKAPTWQFSEEILLSVLTKQFASEKFPLGRMRRMKLTYLLRRHLEGRVAGYLKKPAGPYNPKTKYGGPETIALRKGYVREHKCGDLQGFVAGENIAQADAWFDQWYDPAARGWLEQFRHKKNDELELLATVDMAAEELRGQGQEVTVGAVKSVIQAGPEWKPKLSREVFADGRIAWAIETCRTLFG